MAGGDAGKSQAAQFPLVLRQNDFAKAINTDQQRLAVEIRMASSSGCPGHCLDPAQCAATDGSCRHGHPMKLGHKFSGWTLAFAILILAVVCDGVAVWMGWLSIH